MARQRVSTTVDHHLLAAARALHEGRPDSAVIDAALRALVAQHREAHLDATYAQAYTTHPLDEPDAWGDLASWGDAVRR
ncbi:MAG: antitoxin MazE5 [Mobilicoccus sp.]|nr:antitoxin MazE5 [Mobilicoccus sp.]